MTLRLLAEHHQTLSAPTEDELEALVARWKAATESELAELRAHPEGRPLTQNGCCGPQTIYLRPPWTPNCRFDAERLVVELAVTRASSTPSFVTHVTARFSEKPAP